MCDCSKKYSTYDYIVYKHISEKESEEENDGQNQINLENNQN